MNDTSQCKTGPVRAIAGRRLASLTIPVALTITCSGLGSAQAVSPDSGAGLPRKVYACEYLGACSSKPKQMGFSANNDLIAFDLKWSKWGRATATGKGLVRVAWGGTPKVRKGKVKLTKLSRCGSTKAYRLAEVTWPGQSVKVRLDCP